jgi:hypothetical protein
LRFFLMKPVFVIFFCLNTCLAQGDIDRSLSQIYANRIQEAYTNDFEASYRRKCEQFFTKKLNKWQVGDGLEYKSSEVLMQSLSYYPIPIYRLKNFSLADTGDFNHFLEKIELQKRGPVSFFVMRDSNYLGSYDPLLHHGMRSKSWYGLSILSEFKDIYGNTHNNHSMHEKAMSEFACIRSFNPDFVFHIAYTRFKLMMVKDGRLYFVGYFNEQGSCSVVPAEEWIREFQSRSSYNKWFKLIESPEFTKK